MRHIREKRHVPRMMLPQSIIRHNRNRFTRDRARARRIGFA
jgi:hypothetical protein